jgi:hypothetical protein
VPVDGALTVGAAGAAIVNADASVPAVEPGFVTDTAFAPSVAPDAIVMFAMKDVAVTLDSEFTVIPLPKLTFDAPSARSKFDPFTVTARFVCPCTPLVGFTELTVAAGFTTVKVCGPLVPPAGVFVTVKLRAPVAAVLEIDRFAVSCVALFTVVEFTVMSLPPTFTVLTPL